MQYGNLSQSDIALFNTYQSSRLRKPTFAVWVEGFGDVTDYVISIDTEIAIESLRGPGTVNIGRAILLLDNEGGYFYSSGKSNVPVNARLRIWAGFSDLVIPIFTGYVYSLKPLGTGNRVTVNCRDYMGLFFDIVVSGSQDPNNTPKLILEDFCNQIGALSNIEVKDETNTVYDNPYFDEQRMTSAVEKVGESIFHVAYFDETGTLQFMEREYCNDVDFQFSDENVSECKLLEDSEIINSLRIEYLDSFYVEASDQGSIDQYREKSRYILNKLLNSDLVSSKYQGSTDELVDHDLEGFKFTSGSGSVTIDCLQIKMKKEDAHGLIYAKVYTDSGGSPDSLIGTSRAKASADLFESFSYVSFVFVSPINITPATDYWCILDKAGVTGQLYFQKSSVIASGKHVYWSGASWVLENNKQAVHEIRGSLPAQKFSTDLVEFYANSYERIQIIAPAIPQLQLMDSVRVDTERIGFRGHYIIEGRRHILGEKYVTIDTLRKEGE